MWNSQSSIRACVSINDCVPDLITHKENDMVNAVEARPFWIDYKDGGGVAVGKGGQEAAFLEWNASAYYYPNTPAKAHVGIASWRVNPGEWVFYQFCG